MINIKNFHSNLPTTEKKSPKKIDICNIGYITIKNCGVSENIHSINLLYLTIHSATGHFKEKNSEKCFITDSTDKFEEIWSGIRLEIKTLNCRKKLFFEKSYARIGINTDDDLR